MMENAMEKSLWQAYMDGASDCVNGIIQGLKNFIAHTGNDAMPLLDIVNLLDDSKQRFIDVVKRKMSDYDVVDDAISLSKAQMARVMTLEEVKQAKGRDVWLELSGNIAADEITAATIEGLRNKGN